MGLEDDVRAEREADRAREHWDTERLAKLRWARTEFLAEFADLCRENEVAPFQLRLVHRRSRGYSRAGTVEAWGPLVEVERDLSVADKAAVGVDGKLYRLAWLSREPWSLQPSGWVAIIEEQERAERESAHHLDQLRKSAIKFIKGRS
jgi:hypothetical protein